MQRLIRKYRSWMDVLDTDKSESFCFMVNGTMQKCHQRVLRLITKWPNNNYQRGQVLCIPEHELDKAIRRLSFNKDFARRIQSCQPTAQDVEAIILKASSGYLALELEIY